MSYHRFTRNQKGRLIGGLLGVLLLAACGSGSGGGGGSATPASTPTTATNIPFRLFPADYFSNGHTETHSLTGSDTQGETYTATLTEITQAPSTYNGQPAIPVQTVFVVTDTKTNISETITGINYYSIDPANLMYLGFTDSTGAVLTATSLNIIPPTAMIGDSGTLGTYTGSGTAAGETDTFTWELTNANNGLANFVVTNNTHKGSTLDTSQKQTLVIDQQGKTQTMTIVIYYASSGVTLTLTGN